MAEIPVFLLETVAAACQPAGKTAFLWYDSRTTMTLFLHADFSLV
jgi:hypothetical protein